MNGFKITCKLALKGQQVQVTCTVFKSSVSERMSDLHECKLLLSQQVPCYKLVLMSNLYS